MERKNYLKIQSFLIVTVLLLQMIIPIVPISIATNEIIEEALIVCKNTNIIQEEMEKEILQKETLSFDNCDYEYTEKGNIKFREYVGNADIIVVPEEIEGKKVETIDKDTFKWDLENLEVIIVPRDMEKNISEISYFEKNDILSGEDIVYTTTRDYTETYLKYINDLYTGNDSWGIIPYKFEVLERESNNIKNQTTEIDNTEIPSSYAIISSDYAENTLGYSFDEYGEIPYIIIDDQLGGTCGIYATAKTIETNIAKNFKDENNNPVMIDTSEMHLMVMSKLNGKGNFSTIEMNGFELGVGPVPEIEGTILKEDYIKCHLNEGLTDVDAINSILAENPTEEDWAIATNVMEQYETEYYIMDTGRIPRMDGAFKENSENYDQVIENRNIIKQNIMNNGAVHATVNSYNAMLHYYSDSDGMHQYASGSWIVANDNIGSSTNHAICLVGWDDNFDPSDYISQEQIDTLGITEKGAYLAINSWGEDYGRYGYFWISYQDYYVENCIECVTLVSKGKIDIENNDDVSITLGWYNNKYDGNEKRPPITLKYMDKIYGIGRGAQLRDYTVEYIDNIEPGTAKAVITATGRFQGSVTLEFEIKDGEIIQDNGGTIDNRWNISNYGINNNVTAYIEETEDDVILHIDGEGEMRDFDYINIPWFNRKNDITKVLISDGVQNIGEYSFNEFTNLSEIIMPDSIIKIGQDSFSNCSSLTQLLIPNNVTEIGNYAISNCSNLIEVILPYGLTKIGNGAFKYCSSLAEITLPSSITEIGSGAFLHCSSLTEIIIPGSITQIKNATFNGCTSLTKVIISSGVEKIGNYAFYQCNNLTEAIMPNSITEIGNYAFYECNSLTEIKIPNRVQYIGEWVFFNCYNIEELTVPKSVTNVHEGAFCTNKKQHGDGEKTIVYYFLECEKMVAYVQHYPNAANFIPIALDSIAIKNYPKTEYRPFSKFSLEGLVLEATYTNGKTDEITSGFTSSIAEGTILKILGSRIVVITYEGEETEYTIEVKGLKPTNGFPVSGGIHIISGIEIKPPIDFFKP